MILGAKREKQSRSAAYDNLLVGCLRLDFRHLLLLRLRSGCVRDKQQQRTQLTWVHCKIGRIYAPEISTTEESLRLSVFSGRMKIEVAER